MPQNEGPPDLDEILRKLQQKIAGLFGLRTGAGAARPDGPRPVDTGNGAIGRGVAALLVLIVLVWGASGFYIVDEGRRGVVLRLGKYLETTMPGPRWHWPYPLESVEIVNVSQVRPVEVGYRGTQRNAQPQEAQMLTDDENIVDVRFAVQWNVKSPEDYLFNNNYRDPDDIVRQAAETSIREVVGKSKMDFVLNQGRGEIAARVKVLMQHTLDRYKTGINITTVALQGASAPEQVQPAFEDVVRAGQDRERFKNEGQAYANDVVPKARGIAARLIEEANGYKASVVSTAQGDAARFRQILTEYEKAPQVTRERIYLDTMQQILSSTTKVVVDTKGGNNLLYLPIDKIMQMSNQQSGQVTVEAPRASATPDSSTSSTPTLSEPMPSRRDALRSRDRDAAR